MHGGGGMHGRGGVAGRRVWQILRDAVNERTVRFLLECILVGKTFFIRASSVVGTG